MRPNKNNNSIVLLEAAGHSIPSTYGHYPEEEFRSLNIKSEHPQLASKATQWFSNNCYSLTLAIDASGHYTTKTGAFNILPGAVFFSRPDTCRQLEWYSLNEMYHITFSERFFAKYAGVELFKMFPFLVLETAVLKRADGEILNDLRCICQLIDREHCGSSPFKKNIIANLLVRLLLRIKRNFWEGYEVQPRKDREQDIVKRFIRNLEHHSQQLHQGKVSVQLRVKDYAQMQGVHENYLYTVIKEKTGKMVSQWIAEKTVLVAESLLNDRSLSIKEVSYRLGFPYISYFTIYIKKHTGLTPKDFRKKIMS